MMTSEQWRGFTIVYEVGYMTIIGKVKNGIGQSIGNIQIHGQSQDEIRPKIRKAIDNYLNNPH